MLHEVGSFKELMKTNLDIREGLRALLTICREIVARLGRTEGALVRSRGPTIRRCPAALMLRQENSVDRSLTWSLM
jgi:hypothetical protein